MGIKVHTIPIDPETRKVDIKHVKRAMCVCSIPLFNSVLIFHPSNGNTIMVTIPDL
jgi:sphinganine-1-phosphate aldolase